MKSSYTGATKELAIGGGLLTVAASSFTALVSQGSVLPDSVWLGFGGFSAWMLLRSITPSPSKIKRVFKNTVSLPGFADDPDFKTTYIKHGVDGVIGQEFIFRHRALSMPVAETRLSKMVELGQRRQRRATYNSLVQFKITQAWSRKYFTKSLKGVDAFPVPEFNACLKVLSVVGAFQILPRAGHPGALWQDDLQRSSGELVDSYVKTWQRLDSPSSGDDKKYRFWRTS